MEHRKEWIGKKSSAAQNVKKEPPLKIYYQQFDSLSLFANDINGVMQALIKSLT